MASRHDIFDRINCSTICRRVTSDWRHYFPCDADRRCVLIIPLRHFPYLISHSTVSRRFASVQNIEHINACGLSNHTDEFSTGQRSVMWSISIACYMFTQGYVVCPLAVPSVHFSLHLFHIPVELHSVSVKGQISQLTIDHWPLLRLDRPNTSLSASWRTPATWCRSTYGMPTFNCLRAVAIYHQSSHWICFSPSVGAVAVRFAGVAHRGIQQWRGSAKRRGQQRFDGRTCVQPVKNVEAHHRSLQ